MDLLVRFGIVILLFPMGIRHGIDMLRSRNNEKVGTPRRALGPARQIAGQELKVAPVVVMLNPMILVRQ